MRAAVVTGFDSPPTIEDVPIPSPGREQVLVRIETCRLCHTDMPARGDWPIKPSPPFIPGHEGVGIVESLGAGSSHGLSVGVRVALPWLGYSCGHGRYCNSGWETLCTSQQNMGYSMNGGFAESAVGYTRNVVRVPDDFDPLDAAPLTCAGVTTYKAVNVSGARSSSVVAVFGAGGLGHLALQYARVTGAAVAAVDVNTARLDTAREPGAEHVVHAGEEHPIAAIQRLGGADVAVSTAATPKAIEQALGSLARGGTLVCVGLPADNEMKVPVFETVLGGLTIIGSIVGTHRDLEEVFELHRRGETRVLRAEARLDEVNEAIEQVLDGIARAPRLVFDMQQVARGDGSREAVARV